MITDHFCHNKASTPLLSNFSEHAHASFCESAGTDEHTDSDCMYRRVACTRACTPLLPSAPCAHQQPTDHRFTSHCHHHHPLNGDCAYHFPTVINFGIPCVTPVDALHEVPHTVGTAETAQAYPAIGVPSCSSLSAQFTATSDTEDGRLRWQRDVVASSLWKLVSRAAGDRLPPLANAAC